MYKKLIMNSLINVFKREIRYSCRYLSAVSCSNPSAKHGVIRSRFEGLKEPLRFNCLQDMIFENVDKWSNKTAVLCSVTRRCYTYDELYKYSRRFGARLIKSLSINQGDRIAIMLPNIPEYSTTFLGTLMSGAVATTINPNYKQFELAHQLTVTEPKVVITTSAYYDLVYKTLKDLKTDARIIIVDVKDESVPSNCMRYTEMIHDNNIDMNILDNVKIDIDDLAYLLFSSGTTGLPKGVEITHRNIVSTLTIITRDYIRLAEPTTASHQSSISGVLPFYHVFGLHIVLLCHLAIGSRVVTLPTFTPETYLDSIHKDKCSVVPLVPPLAIFLGKHPLVKPIHLNNLNYMLSGAAPLSATDVEVLLNKIRNPNFEFLQAYGLTETSAIASTMYKNTANTDYDSSGELLPSIECKVVDIETGETLPPNRTGELWIRGPAVTRGYYNNEEATRNSFTEDNFFKTGDLVKYSERGDFYITERIKELIKVKGMQVAPAELEALLRTHPDIHEAAVIGVPHETYGEVPKAFVIAKANKKPDPEHIKEFVSKMVASYKKLKDVVIINELPKSSSGKILRRELREKYIN